jgi:hypothetical protein
MLKLTNKIKSTSLYKLVRKWEQNTRKYIKFLSLTRKRYKAPPVFIYQMGKVASSSIHHSLKKQYPGAVAHAHHIGGGNWASELFYEWFKSGQPIKIISPVRDPIGYNISVFFQIFENIAGYPFSQSKLTTEELIRLFLEKNDHDVPLEWFDKNIKKYFNIDVYSSTFPDKGIQTYQSDNVSLLVFRIDISDDEKVKAIQEFLDFPGFSLHNRNISSQKIYHEDYRNFQKRLKLPPSYLAKIRDSKFFRHFYPEQERVKILSKWT